MHHDLFARRRVLFDRVRLARDAAPKATPQRSKLDIAVLRSAQLLTATSNAILSSSQTTSAQGESPLKKWRTRLSRELDILRQASDLLSYAILAKKKKLQTEFLDQAKDLSSFVRKQLPDSGNVKPKDKDERIFNIVVLRRKVHRYETQIIEQIAVLAAADAHHAIAVRKEQQRRYDQLQFDSSISIDIDVIKCDTLRYLTEIKTVLSLLLILT